MELSQPASQPTGAQRGIGHVRRPSPSRESHIFQRLRPPTATPLSEGAQAEERSASKRIICRCSQPNTFRLYRRTRQHSTIDRFLIKAWRSSIRLPDMMRPVTQQRLTSISLRSELGGSWTTNQRLHPKMQLCSPQEFLSAPTFRLTLANNRWTPTGASNRVRILEPPHPSTDLWAIVAL